MAMLTVIPNENLVGSEFRSQLSSCSQQHRLPIVDLDHYHPDEVVLSKINEDIMRRFMVLPLFQLKDQLYVAISDPEDTLVKEFLWHLTGLIIEPVLATREAVARGINKYFLAIEKTADTIQEFAKDNPSLIEEEIKSIYIEDESAPVIKIVQYIISQAIKLTASDIHLEAFQTGVMLRYRIDGVLHEFPPPPLRLFNALISRVKILSNLDIAERRLPQDGRAAFKVNGKEYDLRISIIPNIYGEGVVIRILDTQGDCLNLDDLGFPKDLLKQYEYLTHRPYGIILVTGPTGAGKTTTLYATLKRLYTPEKKMITLEDPVEYKLDGITQIHVNSEIGLTFAEGLRSMLRHDPDIIMLGEIRDLESAEIAIRASLTGHLVFSTLHTNDAPSSVTRLLDMGIPPYLIFSSLLGVVAQRLVRKLCLECRVREEPDPAMLKSIGLESLPTDVKTYSAKGCPACGNIGYKGREAVFELLQVTASLRQLPQQKISPEIIRSIILNDGFVTMRENALKKYFSGLTTLEEILNLTMGV